MVCGLASLLFSTPSMAVRIQLACAHHGHRRRFVRVLRHLCSSRVLRLRPADEGLAEGRDRASPSGTASRAAPDGANRWPDGRPADSSGEMLVEHQDSIVRGQVAFPAVRRALCKTASHRAAPHHLDRATNCQVLVQRQKAAAPGRGALLTRGVRRSLDPAHTGALSTRGSELWAVWSSRRRADFSSYICSFRAEPKATPQAPPLGGFYKTRLRT
jgi:hypothetical protein